MIKKTAPLSERAAIENVKRFFDGTPDSDSRTLSEVFIAAGRNPENTEANRMWLANKMTHLRYHDLLRPVYSFKGGRKRLDKVQLTIKAKRLLGWIESNTAGLEQNPQTQISSEVSLADVMKKVALLREACPQFEINFNVRLKEMTT